MSSTLAVGVALWAAAPLAVLLARAVRRRYPLRMWRRLLRVFEVLAAGLSGLLLAVQDPLIALPAAAIAWAVLVLYDTAISSGGEWSLRWISSRDRA